MQRRKGRKDLLLKNNKTPLRASRFRGPVEAIRDDVRQISVIDLTDNLPSLNQGGIDVRQGYIQ